jgi:mono/diheme cytochrome c family protein
MIIHHHRRGSAALVCAAAAGVLLIVGAVAPIVIAQSQIPSAWNGVYSAEQAKRGEALYRQACGNCHGATLAGGVRAPAVGGPAFVPRWSNRPLSELLDYMQAQMPVNSPGGFTRHQNADILAYLLQKSGATEGTKDVWFDGPEGKAPLRHSADYGKVATVSTKRAEPFYTLVQAERGRILFSRRCGYCHAADPKLSTPKDLVSPMPATFAGHFIERVVNDKVVYPNALALFSKLQSMPGTNTKSISDQERVDIIAYILQANGLPAGEEELPTNTDAMRLMMLNEPGFERIFNGKDFSGWNIFLGYQCQPGPAGCGKHEPGDVLRVENETIVCECNVHGYIYTDKKYRNFTLRLDTRYERPAYYAPEDDDELYSGGSGYLIHADVEAPGYPRAVEVEGRHRDILEFVAFGSNGLEAGEVDLAAKRRSIRPLGQWNSIEITSKDGDMHAKMNGVPVSSFKSKAWDKDGHIVFQSQGAKIYWRNIRIRVEP